MKNYKTSQCFYLTGYVEFPDNDERLSITKFTFLLNALRNIILNGGNLEKGDEISIRHKKGNNIIYSDIRIDKIKYSIDEDGFINNIDLLLYGKGFINN